MTIWKLYKKELDKSEIQHILDIIHAPASDILVINKDYYINRYIVDDALYYVHVSSAVVWKICIYKRIEED